MAYGNTQINYYDDTSIIKTSYTANISGQISRIDDAHKAIRSKAIELGLKIPAGKRLTANASGTSDLALSTSHNILDTAAAINNIPINTDVSQTLKAGGSYTVPVGFNAIAYTITANSLSGQTGGNATANDILSGKTAWVNGVQITGNIPQYTSQTIELPVTITVNATGETIATSSIKTFPKGYYSGAINIKAVYDSTSTSNNKVINIANDAGSLTSQKGNLTIPGGYDYFAPNASYEIPDATFKAASNTGKVTVETSGWVDAGDEIGGLGTASTVTISSVQQNTSGSSQTAYGATVAAGHYYVQAKATAGYITSEIIKRVNLGLSSLSLTEGATGSSTTTVNSQLFSTTASQGYTPGSTKYYKVKDGSIGAASVDSNYNVNVVIGTGWVTGKTVSYAGKDQSYVISSADTAETDHKFTVAAQANTLMKSLTIDTSYIYQQLAKI